MKFTSDIIIGLEVHISLKTQSKLFCSCKNPSFHGKNIKANENVCNICLGYPGSKPHPNKQAVLFALKLANIIGCQIPKKLCFDRKNYFYPDLVKNFQITQDEFPIGMGGKIQIGLNEFVKLHHIHIEEDPGSMVISNNTCLIDYNRSGTPLIELVTNPVMTKPEQAREFLKKLIIILEYLNIFDRYNCTLKADANISIKETNYTRVEIKNINGFKDIEQALEFEINRQKDCVQNNETIKLETRGWDGTKTFFQRSKEEAADYGYYPENDIPPIKITEEIIKEPMIDCNKDDIYYNKINNILEDFDINLEDLEIILEDKNLGEFFNEFLNKNCKYENKFNPQLVANYFRNRIIKILNQMEINFSKLNFNINNLTILIKKYLDKIIDNKINNLLLEKVLSESNFDLIKYIEENDLEQSSDDSFITDLAKKAILDNQIAVDAYKNGDLKSINFLVGVIMKNSRGKANPSTAKQILENILNK